MSDTAVLERPRAARAPTPAPTPWREIEPLALEPCTPPPDPFPSHLAVPPPDREGQFILLVLAAAAAALLLQTSSAISGFLAQWDRFEAMVRSVLP